MKLHDLQQHLADTGRYRARVDGTYGLLTEGAILLALTDGPDTTVTLADMNRVAGGLAVQTAAIRAFWFVEAAGAGFVSGRPKILPEPHRFSRATGGRFDQSNPLISYPKWGAVPYPVRQDARYRVLLDWVGLLSRVGLDIDPAFASCSYGAPQIMGENYAACGYASPFAFAEAMARDEVTQLRAFASFVTAAGIVGDLRRVDRTAKSWEPVAARYNGSAFRANRYHERMADAFTRFGGK